MKENKETEQYLADTVMGRPYGFSVKDRHFYLYPVTLGKMYLLQRLLDNLGIDRRNVQTDLPLEALRLAKEKTDECLTIICYHTCRTPEEVFDVAEVEGRKSLFREELSEEDIAALMITVLTSDKTALFMKYLEIDKEQDRKAAIMRIKNGEGSNNVVFGGKSQFGTLIDTACERYGWTKEYVVWGIDFTSLRLMLADKVDSIYLSNEELRKVPRSMLTANSAKIQADDPKNRELIKSMNWR